MKPYFGGVSAFVAHNIQLLSTSLNSRFFIAAVRRASVGYEHTRQSNRLPCPRPGRPVYAPAGSTAPQPHISSPTVSQPCPPNLNPECSAERPRHVKAHSGIKSLASRASIIANRAAFKQKIRCIRGFEDLSRLMSRDFQRGRFDAMFFMHWGCGAKPHRELMNEAGENA